MKVKNVKTTILSLLLLFTQTIICGQTTTAPEDSLKLEKLAVKSYDLAFAAVKEKKYQIAISYLLAAIKAKPEYYKALQLLEEVRNAENSSFPLPQSCRDENNKTIELSQALSSEKVQILIIVHSRCRPCYNLIDTISKLSETKVNKLDLKILFTEYFYKESYFTTTYKTDILDTKNKRKWIGNIYFDTDLSISAALNVNTLPKIFVIKNGKTMISDWVGDVKRNEIYSLLKKL